MGLCEVQGEGVWVEMVLGSNAAVVIKGVKGESVRYTKRLLFEACKAGQTW